MRKREVDTEWCILFKRILGDELRAIRTGLTWIRRDLQHQLFDRFGLDVSLQTLATYELGTRSVGAARLAQLCIVMDADVRDVYDRVAERMRLETRHRWTVDLVAASQLKDTDLRPLRRWARCRLDQSETTLRIQIGPATLANLAELCDLTTLQLAQRLPEPLHGPNGIGPADMDPEEADIP